jgi:hypothetical protein
MIDGHATILETGLAAIASLGLLARDSPFVMLDHDQLK